MTKVSEGTKTEGPSWNVPWSADEGGARAATLFHATFGGTPQAVVSAPGRINVIGEHTDYMDGLALPTTIPHRTFAAVAPRSDHVVRVISAHGTNTQGPDAVVEFSLDGVAPGVVTGWAAYVAGALWALSARGFDVRGLDLAIDSCLPIGKGLGSSAALEAAVGLGANEVLGLGLDSPNGLAQLAEACVDGEQRFVGVPAGALDPWAALLTVPGEALMLDFSSRPPRARRQPLYFPEYGLAILVIDTGTTRVNTDGRYASRVEECRAACEALGVTSLREVADGPYALSRADTIADRTLRGRARHVITEIQRVRLVASELSGTAPAHERFVTIGKAMYRSHASLDVDFEVSGPELNAAVDAAFAAGALGARLVGGGFNGAAIALVRRADAERTAERIAESLTSAEFAEPSFLLV